MMELERFGCQESRDNSDNPMDLAGVNCACELLTLPDVA
jgi:hypothetical protein